MAMAMTGRKFESDTDGLSGNLRWSDEDFGGNRFAGCFGRIRRAPFWVRSLKIPGSLRVIPESFFVVVSFQVEHLNIFFEHGTESGEDQLFGADA